MSVDMLSLPACKPPKHYPQHMGKKLCKGIQAQHSIKSLQAVERFRLNLKIAPRIAVLLEIFFPSLQQVAALSVLLRYPFYSVAC